ncbi:MAG: hypothetical protein ABSD38_36240, partial [Syntrophorhabdales bacterium]
DRNTKLICEFASHPADAAQSAKRKRRVADMPKAKELKRPNEGDARWGRYDEVQAVAAWLWAGMAGLRWKFGNQETAIQGA